MSTVAELAEALKVALNAAAAADDFSMTFLAERKYIPRFELATVGETLSVQVVPKADDRTLIARRTIGRDIPIDVGIMKRLPDGVNPDLEAANAYIDPLVAFVKEVADFLDPGMRVGDADGGVIVRTTVEPVYSPDHLTQQRVFLSVISTILKTS